MRAAATQSVQPRRSRPSFAPKSIWASLTLGMYFKGFMGCIAVYRSIVRLPNGNASGGATARSSSSIMRRTSRAPGPAEGWATRLENTSTRPSDDHDCAHCRSALVRQPLGRLVALRGPDMEIGFLPASPRCRSPGRRPGSRSETRRRRRSGPTGVASRSPLSKIHHLSVSRASPVERDPPPVGRDPRDAVHGRPRSRISWTGREKPSPICGFRPRSRTCAASALAILKYARAHDFRIDDFIEATEGVYDVDLDALAVELPRGFGTRLNGGQDRVGCDASVERGGAASPARGVAAAARALPGPACGARPRRRSGGACDVARLREGADQGAARACRRRA